MEGVLCLAPVMRIILERLRFDPWKRRDLRLISKAFKATYDSMTRGECIGDKRAVPLENTSRVRVHVLTGFILSEKSQIYPKLTHLEIFKSNIPISSRLFHWFPNLEIAKLNCGFSGDGEPPSEMPHLKTLSIEHCPWENPLLSCPSLREIRVFCQVSSLFIEGESMDYISISNMAFPLTITLNHCHKLRLWASVGHLQTSIQIRHVDIFDLEPPNLPYYTIERIDFLRLMFPSAEDLGICDLDGRYHASIGSIGTMLTYKNNPIKLSGIPVENLVVGCTRESVVHLRECPLLKRVVLIPGGGSCIQSIDVSIETSPPPVLVVALPIADLRKSTKKVEGIKKIVFTEITKSVKGPQFPKGIETFYKPRRQRGSRWPVVTEDEDYNWFKLVYIY